MSRLRMTLEDLLKAYYLEQNKIKKYNGEARERRQRAKEDKYAGLAECFRNVRKCNTAGKLAYY